jgi:hypothetical protein
MARADDRPRAVMVLTSGDLEVEVGPVEQGTRCDLTLVDHLLRLRLDAARWGWSLRIRDVSPELRELFELVGLTDQLEA